MLLLSASILTQVQSRRPVFQTVLFISFKVYMTRYDCSLHLLRIRFIVFLLFRVLYYVLLCEYFPVAKFLARLSASSRWLLLINASLAGLTRIFLERASIAF